MKKLFLLLAVLTLLSVFPASLAGDVPESLLGDDNAKVFFGKVVECEERHIVVEQIKNIKGEFEEGALITHDRYTAMDSRYALKEKIYLCGLSDESNFYLWETDGMDPATLKLTATDNLSQRMQRYLNEGLFEKKEQERIQALENASRTKSPALNTPSSEQTGQAGQTALHSHASENKPGAAIWPYAAAAGAAAVIAAAVFIFFKKR